MSVTLLSDYASPGNPVMVTNGLDDHGALLWHHRIWCPGCGGLHTPRSRRAETPADYAGTTWEWDGNAAAPTFSPSYLTWWTNHSTGQPVTNHRCHSFIRAGRWEFLGDCTHRLAGQTVDMVPVPDWIMR